MRRAIGVGLVVLAMACGGGGGGRSAQERCEDWCARYNADPECGADVTSCSASCSSIILSAGSRCSAQVDTLFACTEGADLCTEGGVLACSAENTALTTCTTGGGGDAGAPVCTIAGTYRSVRGGTSATACGRSIETFTDGTVVIAETAGGVSITVSDTTANGGETTDCAGTIDGCTIEATCTTGGGTVRYVLELTGPGFSGMAYVQIDDCAFPYSIEGTR